MIRSTTMNEKQKTIFLSIFIAIALGVGYLLGAGHSWHLTAQIDELEARVAVLYEQAETAEYRQHIAEVELGIEQAASATLQRDLAASRDENIALRSEIGFYQKVMAPELSADGVAVETFELFPLRQEGHYQFRLALIQSERQKNLISGAIKLTLEGRSAGASQESLQFDLYDLANLGEGAEQFSMRYFSTQTGSFQLPTHFEPEQVRIAVRLAGSGKELERSFLWSELVSH